MDQKRVDHRTGNNPYPAKTEIEILQAPIRLLLFLGVVESKHPSLTGAHLDIPAIQAEYHPIEKKHKIHWVYRVLTWMENGMESKRFFQTKIDLRQEIL
ncbi:MAG: hypothetical protein A2Y97_09605 [Nitrospirae bacterium RBG_13_39_12]|nr:MAG: hypothetical protein A2Y97_09605 [Nitrospirae bacterium RBG_13_39_12]